MSQTASEVLAVSGLEDEPTSFSLKTLGSGQELWVPLGRDPEDYANEVAASMGIEITPPPTAQAGVSFEEPEEPPEPQPRSLTPDILEVAEAQRVERVEKLEQAAPEPAAEDDGSTIPRTTTMASQSRQDALAHPHHSVADDAPMWTERQIVCVLGGPGSGKSSHCARLAGASGYTHVSAGQALKNASQDKSFPDAAEIAACMKAGRLVPSAIVTSVLKKCMEERSGPVLLDGFPRIKEHIEVAATLGAVKGVIFLDAPEDVLRKRLDRGELDNPEDEAALLEQFTVRHTHTHTYRLHSQRPPRSAPDTTAVWVAGALPACDRCVRLGRDGASHRR